MTDAEIVTAVIGAGGAIGTGVLTLGRWLGGIWRDIRREEIAAAKENAAAQRLGEQRMVDALLKQAESNGALAVAHAQLGSKIDGLSNRLDEALHERTPVETETPRPLARIGKERGRTNPHGYYPPGPARRDD